MQEAAAFNLSWDFQVWNQLNNNLKYIDSNEYQVDVAEKCKQKT